MFFCNGNSWPTSKTVEFRGSHFQAKSICKFRMRSRKTACLGKGLDRAPFEATHLKPGCNPRNWSPTERRPPGYLRPHHGINWIVVWKLLLFVLGRSSSPEGTPVSSLQSLTKAKTAEVGTWRSHLRWAQTQVEASLQICHHQMICIAWTNPTGSGSSNKM